MKEPNIGIRLKTPVRRPRGRARLEGKLKRRLRTKTEAAVAQALIRETVIAPETYLLITVAMRLRA